MKENLDPHTIVTALQSILPVGGQEISLHQPYFAGNEWSYLKECLDSSWVSSAGGYVGRFERLLAEFTGAPFVVATVNGTAALHICLLLAGVRPGDEVLLPSLTFVATANAISYCGAVPHFIDSEELTMGVDPVKLDTYLSKIAVVRNGECHSRVSGRRITTLVPMHTFGHPVDLDPLVELCHRYRLALVEDAAEALGSYYRGEHVGKKGLVSAFSFNGNKIITTGGGGAIVTSDPNLAQLARHLTTQAKLPHPWAFNHDLIGYNYRMPNLNAALGCAQLEQLPGFIERKRALALHYQEAFAGVRGVKIFHEADFAQSNYWLNALLLDEDLADQRDNLLELTRNLGIMTRPVWTLMHKLPMYSNCPRMDLSVAKSLGLRIINLPSSPALGECHG